MKHLYWLAVLLCFLAVGCAGAATVEPGVADSETAVSPTADSDLTVINDDDGEFSISLPAGWTNIEASSEAFAQMRCGWAKRCPVLLDG